jgi:hypothetical protein
MKTREKRDLFPGALEMMILKTLKRQPLHGYALVQQIKRASNDLLQIEEGSLYPALQRLERRGNRPFEALGQWTHIRKSGIGTVRPRWQGQNTQMFVSVVSRREPNMLRDSSCSEH